LCVDNFGSALKKNRLCEEYLERAKSTRSKVLQNDKQLRFL